MDENEKNTKEVYDKIASSYAESTFPQLLQYQLTQFIGYLPEKSKILDAGCGSGKDVKFFIEEKFDVTGIDFSKAMIEEAKKRVEQGNFQTMDMSELKFDKQSFGGVWCCNSLMHIPKYNVSNVLKGFHDVLKDEGILFVTVTMGEGEKIIHYEKSLNLPKFFSFYKPAEIKKLLEDAGFKILESFNEEDDEFSWINLFCKKI